MHPGNGLTRFLAPLWTALFHRVPFSLCFGKRLFLFSKETRIINMFFVTGYSKGSETNVNANGLHSVTLFRRIAHITRDRREPFTSSSASDCARFRDTVKRSMLDNADTAYFAQSQAFIVQSATVGKLRIRDRIIAILTLVSGKASFFARLCFLFETAKECFECQINTYRDLLENLRIYFHKTIVLLFQQRQLDLTRFGGYLMSNQKGAPLCHQPVHLIQPS